MGKNGNSVVHRTSPIGVDPKIPAHRFILFIKVELRSLHLNRHPDFHLKNSIRKGTGKTMRQIGKGRSETKVFCSCHGIDFWSSTLRRNLIIKVRELFIKLFTRSTSPALLKTFNVGPGGAASRAFQDIFFPLASGKLGYEGEKVGIQRIFWRYIPPYQWLIVKGILLGFLWEPY